MSESKAKRQYHSPRRQEQAELTRRSILEAARRLFAEQGYAATTLPAIAREAGVSPPTITAVFGTKPALLDALIALLVRGDVGSTPMAERSWWQEMLAEPDPRRQLQRFAGSVRRIHEGSADVQEIVRGAATADPEIAAVLRARRAARFQDIRGVAESLVDKGALAAGITVDEAVDLIGTLSDGEVYRILVFERGWASERYERWLASLLISSLLESVEETR